MPASMLSLRCKMFLAPLVGAALTSGCRTTDSTPAATSPAPQTTAGALDPTLDLSKSDEQIVYLKMLGVELDAGVKVSKDQLHSSSGVLECRKDGVLESCLLRVRLMERELSGPQPLTPDLSKLVMSYIASARADLKDERVVLTDVTCDYIGKKSPPYDVEDVNCTLRHPRLVKEAVFGDPVAEEIVIALRGESKETTFNGAVSCRVVESSGRSTCVVRALSTGVLADKVTELAAKSAAPVARRLLQATLDYALLTSTAESKNDLVAPSELIGTLVCVVDGSQHLCRATL